MYYLLSLLANVSFTYYVTVSASQAFGLKSTGRPTFESTDRPRPTVFYCLCSWQALQ